MRRLGKYTLVSPIASGGMAEVWRAEVAGPAGFVKQVALKLVRADRGDDGEMIRMFIQEARLASLLHHANVVHVFDLEEVDGRYLLAMELVHGKSLRAVLDRCRELGLRFGLSRSLQVATAVARALAYAHRPVADGGVAGLVHRDVSPHNVLVSFEGEVKLTDFGIARALDAGGLTNPGTVKGKAGYMAPEQALGGPVDARADVFALGVILWELCCGRTLFARDTEAATLRALTGEDRISPPSFWNEGVPPELDALVLGALERDPARRIATADELAGGLAEISLRVSRSAEDRDLRPLMRRLWPDEVPSRPSPPGPGEAPAREGPGAGRVGEGAPPEGTRTVTWRPPGRPGRGVRWALAVAGLAAALALAAGLRASASRPGGPGAAASLPAPVPPAPGGVEVAAPSAGVSTSSVEASPPAAGVSPPVAEVSTSVAVAEPSSPPAAPPAGAGAPPQAPRATRSPQGPAQVAGDAPPTARRPVSPPPPGSASTRPPVVREASDGLGGLELPAPASREGILFVNTVPWAHIFVDGEGAGDTPRELRLAAGRHVVRLEHPTLGDAQETVRVPAGQRVRLETPLKR